MGDEMPHDCLQLIVVLVCCGFLVSCSGMLR